MRSRNLALAAIFSIVLIVGVAWYGERTRYVRPPAPPRADDRLSTFTVELDPPVVLDMSMDKPKPREAVAAPAIDDTPARPQLADFTVPLEPPNPVVDTEVRVIPLERGESGLGAHAWSLSELDQAPSVTYQARPVYPDNMRRGGLSGEVLVDFIVDPEGDVRNAVAVHSSQHEFEEPACNAVSRWKFRPGKKGGHAVFVHMQVPIVFALGESS
jgi:protein TonB